MTDSREGPSRAHRVFGVFKAPETAALWLIIVLLGFFGAWSWLERHEQALEDREPLIQLAAQDGSGSFQIRVRCATPRFVAIYHCPEGETPELLFPRLGPPRGLPWPLSADAWHVLPGKDEFFHLSPALKTRLFVLVREDALPLLQKELWQEKQPEDRGRLDQTSWRSFLLPWKKKP